MFGNCCGRKKTDKHKKITKDAETQSDNEVLGVLECPLKIETILENLDNNKLDNLDIEILVIDELDKLDAVIDQPKTTSDEKRQSVLSEIKIEISPEIDDDEVFCEGVGPPMKLADNLGTPENNSGVPLPKWFSLEGDEDQLEIDGVQEPPVTPIGKDELALRRHRFFSELLSASQNANEHRVHFDPLGPVTVPGTELLHHSSQELEQLVTRLESVTARLEGLENPTPKLIDTTPNPVRAIISRQALLTKYLSETMDSGPKFQAIMGGSLAKFLRISADIGGDISTQGRLVQTAFQAQQAFLQIAATSARPSAKEVGALIQPIGDAIIAVQELRENLRGSVYFNHLSAISESIPALGWVTITNAPAPFVKEMNDSGQFYTNRVLKEWKERDIRHVEWAKAWVITLNELQAFVKYYHVTGVTWNPKGSVLATPIPPPPPTCPPPPCFSIPEGDADPNNDRSALFAQINQGQDITKGLKKVKVEGGKSPAMRTGPAPFKAAAGAAAPTKTTRPGDDKAPTFLRDGKKWMIEYQRGNPNLVVENVEMNNVVYLYKCSDSTVTVKGKINSITLDSCKKTAVVFDSLVSGVECINCQSVQLQVIGKVPTVSIDKTDGCQIYLSAESLGVEIVSSKSSEMNVLVPDGVGEYTEYPVPEQYKTTVVPGKGLSTVIVESKG